MHFPLTQIHAAAKPAAEGSECARDQGKFWEFHDEVFENQAELGDGVEGIKKIAARVPGIDITKFNSCLDGGAKSAIVDQHQTQGLQVGVQGTPTFYINGIELVGAQPYSAFKQIIDSELAG